ncbi:N-acetyltransferase [Bacillus sp. NP157]|nr:N-acetyltransferase [Bacillus sp. NP157]
MSETPKPLEITHDRANQVFLAHVDGHECELDYRLEGKTMVITHTGVPEPVGGRGIANLLTRQAVKVAENQGWKIRPACSYAATWFRRNPEYGNLLA